MSWNWKKTLEDELRMHERRRDALENIREKRCILEEEFTALKSATMSAVPISGGLSRNEDRQINNIVERDRLASAFRTTAARVRLIDRALKSLDERQLRCIQHFYIRPAETLEELCQELGYEKSRIYQLRDEALYRLAVTLYGGVES